MLRSNSRPRLRLAAAGLALCGGLAAATPALAATGSPAGQLAVSGAKHGPSTLVVGDNGAVDTLNPYNGFTSLVRLSRQTTRRTSGTLRAPRRPGLTPW